MSVDPRVVAVAESMAPWVSTTIPTYVVAEAAVNAADKFSKEQSLVQDFAGLMDIPVGTIVRSDAGTVACRFWDREHGVLFGQGGGFLWADLALPVVILAKLDAPDKWISINGVRVTVCSVCEDPTESEPCREHQPNAFEAGGYS